MLKEIKTSVLAGIIIMILAPIAIIALFATLIGIPLSLIILAFWIIAMFTSKIIVSILAGRYILTNWKKDAKKKKEPKLLWAMVLGTIVTCILYSIPVLGWLLALISMWWGIGGLWLHFKK